MTDEERTTIRSLHGNGVPLKMIAEAVNRPVGACSGVVSGVRSLSVQFRAEEPRW